MHDPWMLVETTRATEFDYNFACTRKGVHLYSVTSPGLVSLSKSIFSDLGLCLRSLGLKLNGPVKTF